MADDVLPVAGMRFYIGPQKASQAANFTATDFASITTDEDWVEVDGWETVGAFGDAAAVISADFVNRGRTVKLKGPRNAGTMDNVFGDLPADPGQIAMAAAEKTSVNYAFRILGNDTEGNTTPTSFYFVGLVMSWREQGGAAATMRMRASTIEINSNIAVGAAVPVTP